MSDRVTHQSGRLSDIYHPKPVFITGFFVIGVFGIGAGFVNNIIGLIIIRAIQGFGKDLRAYVLERRLFTLFMLGAALTIPSAISILTSAFPDGMARAIALTLYVCSRDAILDWRFD
jgi:MFS family permease